MKGRVPCTTLLLYVFFNNKNLCRRQRLGSVVETWRYLLMVGFRISDKELKDWLIDIDRHIEKPQGSI